MLNTLANLSSHRTAFYNFFTQVQSNQDKAIKFTEINDLRSYLFNVYDIYEHLTSNSSVILDHKMSNVYYSLWVNRTNTQVVVQKPSREVSATLEVIFSKMTFAFGLLKSLEITNRTLWNERKNFSAMKPAILEILERVDEGA